MGNKALFKSTHLNASSGILKLNRRFKTPGQGIFKVPIFKIGDVSWHTMKIGRVGAISLHPILKLPLLKGLLPRGWHTPVALLSPRGVSKK